MKKLSLLALATVLALGGAAAPALAATGGGAPASCATGGDEALLSQRADTLATQLQLSTKLDASVSVWGGCLKVMSTDASGMTTVAFYDPDTFRLLGQMS